MRARSVAPFILPACVVVLCGCFNYGLPYPSDMAVDTEPDPDVSDVQDSTEPDTELDPDADPDTVLDTGDDFDADADADPDAVLDPDLDVEPDSPPAPPVFVVIPAGSFTMGSRDTEPGHDTDEDEHSVTLTRSFEIMDKEVTQDQFDAALAYRPSSFGSCGSCPVETVNWHEAAAYANAQSLAAGLAECYTCTGIGTGVSCSPSTAYSTPYECPGYRLPTEAEWERAARAGSTDATYNGTSSQTACESPNSVLDPIAWFCGNSSSMTHAVGGKDPNGWGLYDMLGNVHEWCNDWYSAYSGDATDPWGPSAGTEHVVRGGSWDSYAGATRAAYRYHDVPGRRENLIGFRVVRSLPRLPVFVVVPAGTFTMGSPGTEPGRGSDETVHSVTLTRSFEMMETEVTQDEFDAVLGYRPSSFGSCGGTCPVETVSWNEAAAFANAVSVSAGLAECYTCTGTLPGISCTPSTTYSTPYECPGYRLPTEAEWERAARAGTTGGTYNGTSTLTACESPNSVLDPIAWFCGNSSSLTHSVGYKMPNAWGLYDMLGNVLEWCEDWYVIDLGTGDATDPWGPGTGSNRAFRGGHWNSGAGSTRAAVRGSETPGFTSSTIGFRLVRTLPLTTGFTAIPAGTFTMGSPTGELGRETGEMEHSVTLTRPFEMMEKEVTQDQFFALMAYASSYFTACGGTCPVEQVSWHMAAAYANALSDSTGLSRCYTCAGALPGVSCTPSTLYSTPYDCPGYRLPTEAEWEYAARAGTTQGTYNGTSTQRYCESPNLVLDPIAWFCPNSGVGYAGCYDLSGSGGSSCSGTHPVGSKEANPWGLLDMLGNVFEWCHDWHDTYPGTTTDPWGPGTGTNRVTRGGCWNFYASSSRAAFRYSQPPGTRNYYFGFRLVRTLP